MEFLDIVKSRCSTRAYLDKKIEDNKLLTVLEAGRLAPSACNIQPWHIVVLREKSAIDAMKPVYGREWFVSAPVIIAVCVDTTASWKRRDGAEYALVDAAIVMDHMILQAAELGLGSCWIGAFDEAEATKVLKLPAHIKPVVLTPLGYPAGDRLTKKRKALEEIIHWDRF